jgi:transposase
MVKGKARDQSKERRWRRWLQEWRDSGLTVREFCEWRSLSEANFYAWRRTLDQRKTEAVHFVPVHVVVEEQTAADATLVVVLPGNRLVRVAPGFDAATLQRLLAVLEDKPC